MQSSLLCHTVVFVYAVTARLAKVTHIVIVYISDILPTAAMVGIVIILVVGVVVFVIVVIHAVGNLSLQFERAQRFWHTCCYY